MRIKLFLLFTLVPLLLVFLTSTKFIQLTNDSSAARILSLIEQKKYTQVLEPENLKFLDESFQDLSLEISAVASAYQPIPEILADLSAFLKPLQTLALQKQELSQNGFDLNNTQLKNQLINTSLELEQNLLNLENTLALNKNQIPQIPNLIPSKSIRDFVGFLKTNYDSIFTQVHTARQGLTVVNQLLGFRQPHTVLLLVQNNNELRATGGFIGLLGFLELDNASVKSLEFHNIYDFDGLFDGYNNVPLEFSDFNEKLFIRDLNFSADFPPVAHKIEAALQEAGAPSFDTIVAINHELFKDLTPFLNQLQIADKSYTAGPNFDFILSYLVESKSLSKTSPKKLIASMLADLPQQILDKLTPYEILDFVKQAFASRNLQAYSKNHDLDDVFEKLNFRLSLQSFQPTDKLWQDPKQTHNQSLLCFNSVAGTKADRFIERHITFTEDFSKDFITTQVDIDLYHSYSDQTEAILNGILHNYGLPGLKGDLRYILGRGDYRVFLRSYLPANAVLEQTVTKFFASPDPYSNLASFVSGFGMTPSNLSRLSFVYKTPINHKSLATVFKHSFSSLRQSGLKNTQITHILNTQNLNLHTFSPKTYKFSKNHLSQTKTFDTDFHSEFVLSFN